MLKVRRYLLSATLLLSAQAASADLLFTNFDGDPSANALYTSGGNCSLGSCFAGGDNFSNDAVWKVTGFTFYIASINPVVTVGQGARFAVFSFAGAQVVAPTDVTPTVTDTGLDGANATNIYKFEITGLDIVLVPGEYEFRFTSTVHQDIYLGLGNASAQSIDPGLFQLTGSQSVESLLSDQGTQRTENWAFQVIGTTDTVFEDSFEAPDAP